MHVGPKADDAQRRRISWPPPQERRWRFVDEEGRSEASWEVQDFLPCVMSGREEKLGNHTIAPIASLRYRLTIRIVSHVGNGQETDDRGAKRMGLDYMTQSNFQPRSRLFLFLSLVHQGFEPSARLSIHSVELSAQVAAPPVQSEPVDRQRSVMAV